MRRLAMDDLEHRRSCGLCDASSGSRRQRSGGRNPQLRMQTLLSVSRVLWQFEWFDIRFSPVWLYMCVWSELGRVKRLSQILHLCFFCELDETLELNWPIIDCGAGGMEAPKRALGRGSVLELVRSTDSEAEL